MYKFSCHAGFQASNLTPKSGAMCTIGSATARSSIPLSRNLFNTEQSVSIRRALKWRSPRNHSPRLKFEALLFRTKEEWILCRHGLLLANIASLSLHLTYFCIHWCHLLGSQKIKLLPEMILKQVSLKYK